MPKEKNKLWYRKKGCELAKKIHRTQVPYCEICGKSNCKIEAHHLLTVGAHPKMSNQDCNLISLCVHCHKFGRISFHGSGTDLMKDKLNAKFPGRMDELRKKARDRKPNYQQEYEELCKIKSQ
jgi:hypothetical protein